MAEGSARRPGRDPAVIVQAGYDSASNTHLDWIGRIEGDPRLTYVDVLLGRLPPGASVLELGCGAGVPVTQRIAEVHRVTGVDISAAQLDHARRLVPHADFVQADMSSYGPANGPFDAVVAVYSVSHVPRETHESLFTKIASWLRPGGFFLASLGAKGCRDTVQEWLGVPMFFSSWDADENRQLLRSVGFKILIDDVVTMQEPEGRATFLWVLAKRPNDGSDNLDP